MSQNSTNSSLHIKRLVLAAMFLAVGFLLPFLTAQNQQLGQMLLLMHLPVFLCGLICGWKFGGLVGFILPISRSLIMGMPPMFPVAFAMAFELAAYGIVVAIVYALLKKRNILTLYIAIIAAMLVGRVIWGLLMWIQLTAGDGMFTLQAFLTGAFVNAWPGIIVQLVLIPIIIFALERAKLIPLK